MLSEKCLSLQKNEIKTQNKLFVAAFLESPALVDNRADYRDSVFHCDARFFVLFVQSAVCINVACD
jgi:hypothetical protein